MREAAMPVVPQDRPINALREETIDQLVVNYGHGKLSLAAFERRLDEALDTQSHDRLLELTKDLDLRVDKQYVEQKRAELGMRVESVAAGDEGADEAEHMINIFGGTNRGGQWDVPSRIRMLNLFGGADLDFSEARFTSQMTRITMLCIFGGVTLRVREGVRTVSKAVCIFGGVDNRGPSTGDRNAPTIVLQGLVLFGGAEIKIKKTAKERWLEFADTVKEMFAPVTEKTRTAK
jgi:hypothetical protein